jgi:hypothetical protein
MFLRAAVHVLAYLAVTKAFFTADDLNINLVGPVSAIYFLKAVLSVLLWCTLFRATSRHFPIITPPFVKFRECRFCGSQHYVQEPLFELNLLACKRQ